MSKPVLVVAISDENYLSPLELGLAERLYEQVELEVISDRGYFEEYFTAPRSIDLMICDETFYSAGLGRHNIQKLFVLVEDMEDAPDAAEFQAFDNKQTVRIFKYLNLQVLMSSIIPRSWSGQEKKIEHTEVIAVISAEGGAGCTTLALGVSACLRQSLKRVLYINENAYQSFHFYLKNKDPLPMQGCAKMRTPSGRLYIDMKPELQQEGFTYLPPLPSSRYALNIPEKAYMDLIQAAQLSKEYDRIVVDIGNEITPESIPLLDMAAKVLIVTRQDEASAFKMRVLLHNINCGDKEKFLFLCNRYDPEQSNAFIAGEYANMVKINEYVAEIPLENEEKLKELAKSTAMQKAAYALM